MQLRTAIGGLTLASALVPLNGCDVDNAAIPPPRLSVSVIPAFLCAGEETVASWDAGDQTDSPACRPGLVGSGPGSGPSRDQCIIVSRSSPIVSAWDGSGDTETRGSVAVTVPVTTSFSAQATVANHPATHRSHTLAASATATVITEGDSVTPTALRFTFAGGCVGATSTWTGVNLKESLSGCLEVVEVCNASGHTVELTDVDDTSRSERLITRQCTTRFNGRGPSLSGRIEDLPVDPRGLRCGEERTTDGTPSFDITVSVLCNRDLSTCPF